MTAGQRVPGRKSLEELLAVLDAAEDSEGAVLQLILESAVRRDPELPDLIRACAIPRTLNAEVVGVLRGTPDDADGNSRLLGMISEYSFVLSRPDGGLIYHDNTRDYLLADWRATEDKRARFAELNNALADFYVARYMESENSGRYLSRVSALIGQANPERRRRLAAVVESGMRITLLEATYHKLLASPEGGFNFFKDQFFELEQASQITICQSLISFIRDFLKHLPQDEGEPILLAWLDYFDARVRRTLPGYDADHYEGILRALIARADAPAQLRLWALDDLAQVYQYQGKLDAALGARLEAIEQGSDADIYNEPLRYHNLGLLYWWLGDHLSAVRYLARAAGDADELPGARADIGVLGRLDLSAVHAELSDWTAAFEEATEALWRARTSYPGDQGISRAVATRLAQLLSRFDRRASDCASAEAVALAEITPEGRKTALADRIDLLLSADRIGTALALADRVAAELDGDGGDPSFRFALAFRRAAAAEAQERYADAESAYSALLEEMRDEPGVGFMGVSALMHRGTVRAKLGKEAVADLTAAREEWRRIGSSLDAVDATVRLAGAYLTAGDIAAARNLLAEAEPGVPLVTTHYRLGFLTVKGELEEELRHWPAAEEHYQKALDLVAARRDLEGQASLLRKLAALHRKRSRLPESAAYDRRASEIAERIAEADADSATARQRAADEENARGMRSFSEAEDRTMTLDRARQYFASAADLDPGNLWPLLNLSFACAEQQDWQEASAALERALDGGPGLLWTARLRGCLRDYVAGDVRAIFRGGNAAQAAAAAAAALGRLSGKLTAADLAPVAALHCTALAVAGKTAAAGEACRTALQLAGSGSAFAQTAATLVETVDAFWAADDMLGGVAGDSATPVAIRNMADDVRGELRTRLDEMLGLTSSPSAAETLVTTPIVVEIGDDLLPIVDPSQDEGVFLYQLIPAMRERIRVDTGVSVPGVRARGNSGLPGRGFSVQVDEVPVLSGSVPSGASVIRLAADAETPVPEGTLTDFHPLSGGRGMWVVIESAEAARTSDDRAGEASALSPVQCLICGIELAIRSHLARYLGPQEATALIDEWSRQEAQEDGDLVQAVVPDADARLLLTWLLQRLVDDGIPVTDWRALLSAVRTAGGISMPLPELRRVVREQMPDLLPGPRTGRKAVEVPAEYEQALLGHPPDGRVASRNVLRLDFLRWLRQEVAVSGAAITLITRSQAGREIIGVLGRAENSMITTLTRDELTSHD